MRYPLVVVLVATVVSLPLPAFAAVVSLPQPAPAAAPQTSDPTVEAMGTAVLDLQPQVLRLKMQIGAAGADTKAAFASLQARQEKVRAKLVELGATPDSIKFTGMSIATGRDDHQRAMQRMIMQRLQNRGGAPTASQPAAATPMRVTVTLKAEWPLQAQEPAQALAMAAEVTKKLKAEDLSGKKDMEQLSAADQEAMEEADDSAARYAEMSEGADESEPMLVYVCKVSKKDQAAALAQAFAKAKAEAEQMAEAAGMKLGGLRQMRSGPESAFAQMMEGGMMDGPRSYRLMQQLAEARQENPDQVEAIAMDPGSLKHHAMLSATFLLVQP